uniref:Uncharacterized protein n=1 Tax=Haloarcula sp. AS7094 TaxID=262078 RepID=Q5VIV8_9EURY|nr:hypothetical protein [Haloarcula sp. AS7094]AAS13419.1 unknown [Haloarcula sp. AS7094]
MVENIFLTDSRRDVLNGVDELTGQSRYNAKSRIRQRARMALQELIEFAASPEINNADIFEPNEIARLLDALMFQTEPPSRPRWNFEGDPVEYRDTYRYQLALYGRLDHTLDGYGEMLHRDYAPGETPDFSSALDE